MKLFPTLLLARTLLTAPILSSAVCNIEGSGEVNIISNSYSSLEFVNDAMEECSSDGVTVAAKMTTEQKEETAQALAASTSSYELAQLSNSTIAPLQAAGQLQSLNDLVGKYKEKYNIEEATQIN